MHNRHINLKSYIIFFLMFIIACNSDINNPDDDDEIKTMESTYNDDESHKNGQNCMNCHVAGGEGEGIFTIAGSVYQSDLSNPYPNSTVKLYDTNLSSIIYTLPVDGLGNFYTTKSIDLSSGCLPQVSDQQLLKQMASSTTIGSCNGCHNGAIESFIYLTSE